MGLGVWRSCGFWGDEGVSGFGSLGFAGRLYSSTPEQRNIPQTIEGSHDEFENLGPPKTVDSL